MERRWARLDPAEVADAASTIGVRVAVQELVPEPVLRHTDAVAGSRNRGEVGHDDDLIILRGAATEEADHTRVRVVAVDPLEPGRREVARVERALGPQEAVEVAHPALELAVRFALKCAPVEPALVVPLSPLAELVAHEQELLPRLAVHVAVEKAEVGELLPLVARHAAGERPLAVHDLVVRQGQDEVLVERVKEPERQQIVVKSPVHRVL